MNLNELLNIFRTNVKSIKMAGDDAARKVLSDYFHKGGDTCQTQKFFILL